MNHAILTVEPLPNIPQHLIFNNCAQTHIEISLRITHIDYWFYILSTVLVLLTHGVYRILSPHAAKC